MVLIAEEYVFNTFGIIELAFYGTEWCEQYSSYTYSEQMVNALLHVIRSVSVYWSFEITIKDVAPSCTKKTTHMHRERERDEVRIHSSKKYYMRCSFDRFADTMQCTIVDCGCTYPCVCCCCLCGRSVCVCVFFYWNWAFQSVSVLLFKCMRK